MHLDEHWHLDIARRSYADGARRHRKQAGLRFRGPRAREIAFGSSVLDLELVEVGE